MNKYFVLAKNISKTISDISFLKYGLPIITCVGVFFFFYYGIKGIAKRNTIILFRFHQSTITPTETTRFFGAITGKSAIFIGFLYLFIGIFLLVFLGTICFFIIF